MTMIQGDTMNAHAQTTAEANPAHLNAKPKTKPKRPLSAFNLFYRFKRQKIVGVLAEAEAAGTVIDKDTIYGLITAAPGLEGVPDSATEFASPETINALQRQKILSNLEGNLEPRDTAARSHRKNRDALNGAMSFVELGKIMNSTWKECDPYAKSVFEELAEEGRERYRLVKKAFNAQSQSQSAEESAKAKVTPAHKKKCTKENLPTKKCIAEEVKSSSISPSPKAGSACAMNETAEAMVQLAAGAPSKKSNNMNASVAKKEDFAAAPRSSLPSLSSKEDVSNASNKTVPNEIAPAAPIVTPGDIPSPSHASWNDTNELLKLRVRELESQLEEERLRARIRDLETERSRRLLAREGLLRSALNNVMAQKRAASVAPPALSVGSFASSSGLQGLLLQHKMQQQDSAGRAAVLSQILDPHRDALLSEHRPSPAVPGINPSSILNGVDGLDGRPDKKQRVDSSFAA